MRDTTGNLLPCQASFPTTWCRSCNAPDGVRELAMGRWGMPGPPAFGGAPVMNIRNTKSPHWRGSFRGQSSSGAARLFASSQTATATLLILIAMKQRGHRGSTPPS
jgi:hypothetical protein